MRHWLTSTAIAIVIAQLGIAGSAVPAAATSVEELAADVEAMKQELAALRKENHALRVQQQQARRDAQGASGPAQPARRVAPAVGPGPYAAAPLATAAPVYAAAPVGGGSWTGFYVGANLGLSVGRGSTTHSNFFSTSPQDVLADTFHMSPFGVIGGVQAGFNWQAAPSWVLGLEADFQGSGESQTACVYSCTDPAAGFTRNLTVTQQLDWFGTARGRFGWTNGPALFYATGGLAYGHVTTDVALNDFNFGVAIHQAAHSAATKTGWTAGFGAEMRLLGNWTAKAEYLYVDLGEVSTAAFTSVFTPVVSQQHQFSSTFQDHIVRLGINYKFGEPVYAAAGGAYGMFTKAPPLDPYTWTGVYAGANLGLSVGRDDTTTSFSTINNTTGAVTGNLSAERFTLSPLGAVGGVQAGYNWQAARHWVLGLEADFQGSSQEGRACLDCGFLSAAGALGTALTQRLDWFGTVRGRLGWTDGPVLYYATAGLAYGHVSTDERVDTIPFTTGVTTAASFGQTKVGWTAGGGAEAHLYGNWTAKAEYLYVDLGNVSGSVIAPELVIPININPANINLAENRGFTSAVHDHIFRLGVNYKLAP